MKLLTIDNFSEYLLEAPLYEEYQIQNLDTLLNEIFIQHYSINAFCPTCNEVCTFIIEPNIACVQNYKNALKAVTNTSSLFHYYFQLLSTISLGCSKNPDHHIHIFNRFNNPSIFKIGQYPKNIEFMFPDKNKYDKFLGKYAIEYKTALQVYSHGTGIGSFVYLRRVFEFLAEDYHQKALKAPSWDEEAYRNEKFGGKVKMIEKFHKFIPDELCNYTTRLYGILSQGIHELDEADCLALFPALKFIIERILDENIEKEKQSIKLHEVLKELT